MRRLLRPLAVLLLVPSLAVAALAWANVRHDVPQGWAASPLRSAAGATLREPLVLRVVTFNVADGYLFTGNRPERMRAIGKRLVALDPDVVGLQEAFVEADREVLLEALAGSRLAHHARFPGAVVGNGLWILSAHPIEESWFHRFESDGSWYRFWEGDWWAGKGVGLARLRLPDGSLLDFYDTHAVAGRGNPTNEWIRLGQMAELARFVKESRVPGAPAFVVGDFNTRPGAPDYELAVREAGLVRAMRRPSRIDHIFAVEDPAYTLHVLDTEEISGTTLGARPAFFVARPPRPGEVWGQLFGEPAETPLSDHPGYLSTVEIRPARPRS